MLNITVNRIRDFSRILNFKRNKNAVSRYLQYALCLSFLSFCLFPTWILISYTEKGGEPETGNEEHIVGQILISSSTHRN